MHEIYQTMAAGELKANTNEAFTLAQKGPVIILSRATPKAVLVSPEEWNRIARRLKILEALQEAQRIETQNAAASWVSSAEIKQRLAERGVDVGSAL